MLWAIGAILLHVQAVPQAAVPATAGRPAGSKAPMVAVQAQESVPAAEKLTLADASVSDNITPFEPGRLVLTPVAALAAAVAPAPFSPAIDRPRTAAFAGRITDGQQRKWVALAMAQHSAAAFDAWSTRRAITQHGAQELNPMLQPFAGNRSIYAATQVAPVLLDLLGRRMMTSHHSLLRHTWWLPQTLGTAASLSGVANNLLVR